MKIIVPTLSLFLVAGGALAAEEIPAHLARQIQDAAPAKPSVPPGKPRRVLIWNTPAHLMDKDPHKDYCIPYGAAALETIGRKSGAFEPMVSGDLALYLPENIGQFDAIVMNNSSGPWITPAAGLEPGFVSLSNGTASAASPTRIPSQDEKRPLDPQVKRGPVWRLRHEGVRAMSNGDPKRLAEAGFNLTLPWEDPLIGARKTTPPEAPMILSTNDFSRESIERMRGWARKCRENDTILVYMINTATEPAVRYLAGLEPGPNGHLMDYLGFGGRDPLRAPVKRIWPSHQYRHVVDMNGAEARWAPCPLEQRFWMGFIGPQLELAARLLLETGAAGGAALELETYCFYSIYPGMASQKTTFCYCDQCFYGFVASRGGGEAPDAVLPTVRFDWLTARGLLPAYEQYLEDALTQIIREMMQAVRRIKPDMLFGMYPYAPFWYYDALVRGAGAPDLPCLVFPSAEYYHGYTADPDPTFFGEVSTTAAVAHIRGRGLHALYAGGLYNRGMDTPEALALAMDRLLRGADGFWVYCEGDSEPLWKYLPAINRWSSQHSGALPGGSTKRSVLETAAARVERERIEGLRVEQGRIAACWQDKVKEVAVIGGSFEDGQEVSRGWKGRGALPRLDAKVAHSGQTSLRFEPLAAGDGPRSPWIDQRLPTAPDGQYEVVFWVKSEASEPVRLWVGVASTQQYPGYMLYRNFVLPPRQDWRRLRIVPVSFEVLRFWCPPTGGRLWLDDVRVRPVRERVIDLRLELPEGAAGWGAVDWRLSPSDARFEAEIWAAEENRLLRKRLYPGDSLAPLFAIVGRQPVRLRLRVYPSAEENVVLEEANVGFVSEGGN